jgi:micrococcal nuclease
MSVNKRPPLLRILARLLWLALGVAQAGPFYPTDTYPESGTVIRVADGDTVTVKFAGGGERRVRLIGVDAPEMDDTREEAAFRAFLSRRFTFHHLYRRAVRLTYDFPFLDEHGRVLAYVWPEMDRLFNDFIIRQGFASAFLKYPFRKDYQERFRAAEAEARNKNRGFWRLDPPPVILDMDARRHLGELVSVRFRCDGVSKRSLFLVLRSAGGVFEALVPLDRVPLFSGVEECRGREVSVSGFLEEFRGRPQIMVAFPRQLRLT